jgi:hypothetical protein
VPPDAGWLNGKQFGNPDQVIGDQIEQEVGGDASDALPEVLDSMVVDLEYLGRESYMPLFVVLNDGIALDDAMRARINKAIEAGLSRRFLPNEIVAVPEIPRTLSGKKKELPIKKLLLGHPIENVINKDAMANPGCLDWYLEFATRHAPHLTSARFATLNRWSEIGRIADISRRGQNRRE